MCISNRRPNDPPVYSKPHVLFLENLLDLTHLFLHLADYLFTRPFICQLWIIA